MKQLLGGLVVAGKFSLAAGKFGLMWFVWLEHMKQLLAWASLHPISAIAITGVLMLVAARGGWITGNKLARQVASNL